jgi:WD40 repeat protein
MEERPWLARVLGSVGVVGAAFAVDSRHVVTCAHVVQNAGANGPRQRVRVDFPALGGGSEAEVLDEGWRLAKGSAGDTAILRLDDPPEGLRPAPLRLSPKGSFVAWGFPEGYDEDEVATQGAFGPGAGREWVQLERTAGFGVMPGFSGTAVWDVSQQAAVAVMVTRDLGTGGQLAFAIPIGVFARDSDIVQEALPTALELDPAAASWDASARGVQAGEHGWLFTGRWQALRELVVWLTTDEPQAVRVVTGSPGCGKSAVLARLVTTSDRRYRQRMPDLADDDPTVAPEGSVDVTFDARGRTVSDLAEHLAAVCQLDAREMPELVGELGAAGRRPVVVLDGLDEATEPEALATVVGHLARAGGRLLVGCRPHLVPRLADPDSMNLDRAPWLEQGDVERYVARRLEGQVPDGENAEEVVREVASAAAGNFLVAQLTADAIAHSGRVTRPFPTDVAEAFRKRLDDLKDESARELLLPLVYALGEGLPENLWLSGVAALSRHYERGDLRRLLRGPASSFVLTSEVRDGQRSYRLFHQALAETLAEESDPLSDQQLLWTEWRNALPHTPDGSPHWEGAPGYLLRHAAEHAAAADRLAELATDAGYLLHGDLYRLRLQLQASSDGSAPEIEAVLGLTASRAQSLDTHQRAALLALAAQHLGLPDTADALTAAHPQPWRPVWAHTLGPPHDILTGHTGVVNAVAFRRVGDRDLLASASVDKTVRLWDPASGQPVGEPLIGHTDAVSSVAFGRVGDRDVLASASDEGTVRLWDPGSGEPVGETVIRGSGYVQAVALGRAGDRTVLVTSDGGIVRLWDPTTGQPIGQPLFGHTDAVSSVAFGRVAGRDLLATASRDGTVRLWDPAIGQPVGEPFIGHTNGVFAVAFGRADGRDLLASASVDKTVRLWDPAIGQPVGEPLTGHTDAVSSVAFGRGGGRDLLASASHDRSVRLWDPTSGQPIGPPLTGHTDLVLTVAFGRAGSRDLLASASYDQTVRLWDLASGEPLGRPLTGHTEPVNAAAFGRADGRDLLASASVDKTARLWDPDSGQPIGEPLTGHTDEVSSVAFGRAGSRDLLASASHDGTVRLWDPASGQPTGQPLTGHTSWVIAVAFGRAGDRDLLASASYDRTVRLWDPASGQPIGEPLTDSEDPEWANAVAFGRVAGRDLLASAGPDGTVRLWDPGSGQPIGELLTDSDQTNSVLAVAFGRAGGRDLLASAGLDGTVRLWDPAIGQPVGEPLTGHTDMVNAVAFGRPDGRDLLASASYDRTVRLWDPTSGRGLAVLPMVEPPKAVALSPSGIVVTTGRALCLIAPSSS